MFLFVVTFVALPLYELADVGEHWPHDGNYVSVILAVLFFVGLTLTLRRSAAIGSRRTVASQALQSGHLEGVARTVAASTRTARDSDLISVRTRAGVPHLKCPNALASILDGADGSRLLILRDFRI
ncbi:MAG: hypothetical protein HY047_04790 [Acidobacteria bacterium]|nr:hypothetical protein [Acidobacteriota bacterium]